MKLTGSYGVGKFSTVLLTNTPPPKKKLLYETGI